MSHFVLPAAIAVSIGALCWLAATDPKRRRSFGLPPGYGPDRTKAAWTLALLPGILIPFWSGGAGFVIWLGAVGVAGWIVSATRPGRIDILITAIRRQLTRLAALRAAALEMRRRLGVGLRAARSSAADDATLEHRIADLETQLSALRRELATTGTGETARPRLHS